MKRSRLLSHGQHAILLSSALLAGAAFRIFSKGPFTPLSCSLYNTGCLPEPPIQLLHVDNDYAHVVDLFKDNIERGDEIGAGVAAYVNGRLVLDVRGGWQDVAKGTPYTDNTLNMVYSSTKMLVMQAEMVLPFSFSFCSPPQPSLSITDRHHRGSHCRQRRFII